MSHRGDSRQPSGIEPPAGRGAPHCAASVLVACSLALSAAANAQVLPPVPDSDPEAQCRRGIALSCLDLAQGAPAAERDRLVAHVHELWQAQCGQGDGAACFEAGAIDAQLSPVQRAEAFARGCELGHEESCVPPALHELFGGGSAQLVGRGLDRLDRACQRGVPLACVLGARAALAGRHGKPEPARARELARRGCGAGDGLACVLERWLEASATDVRPTCRDDQPLGCLGAALEHVGASTAPNDLRGAQAPLARACDRGVAAACLAAADLLSGKAPYLRREVERNAGSRIAATYRRACTLGQRDGCVETARLRLGAGEPREAVSMLEPLCRRGHARACRFLAHSQATESAGPQPADVASALGSACKGHLAEACVELGLLMMDGNGVPSDPVGAVRHFETACQSGHLRGCGALGLAALHGKGVPRDGRRAAELLGRACHAGDPEACEAFAPLADAGLVPGATAATVRALLMQACRGNVGEACRRIETLSSANRLAPCAEGPSRPAQLLGLLAPRLSEYLGLRPQAALATIRVCASAAGVPTCATTVSADAPAIERAAHEALFRAAFRPGGKSGERQCTVVQVRSRP